MNTKPLITVVINFYNNEREAPRSLYTLSAQYQQGIEESEYKVIVIDNGSKKPLDKETVEQFGGNFEFYSFREKLQTSFYSLMASYASLNLP